MNILMVYYAFPHNAMLLREAEALLEKGYHVDIICIGKEEIGKEAYKDNLNIYKVQKRQKYEKGLIAYLWTYARFFILASLLSALLHMRRPYKVVHITSPPDVFVFTSLFPKLFGAKVILDIHDITPEFFAAKFSLNNYHWMVSLLKWIEKISARYSDHVITVTDIWKDTLVNRTVPESKCSVLLNVPDTNLFNRSNMGKRQKSDNFTLLYPGNVDFGLDTLIRAMQIISVEVPSVKLEVYGHGSSLTKLVEVAEDIGVKKFISFNKIVPTEKLVEIMRNVDVGIDPMRDGIFFGDVSTVKSMEFLAMGIPLVTSRRKASRYYFDESMVMFYEPDSYEDLARAVTALYRNPKKRLDLINNASKFSAVHNWNKYKKIYLDIVESL